MARSIAESHFVSAGGSNRITGQKCLPILTYELEVCALPKRVLQSLDVTANRVLMKLFKTSNF